MRKGLFSKLSVALFLIGMSQLVYSQTVLGIEEGSMVDREMQRIGEEFRSGVVEERIPTSRLLEELQRPGNEHLLEQIRNGELISDQEMSELEMDDLRRRLDEAETTDEDDEDEKRIIEYDEEDKLQFTSSVELYFDREVYYQSIRDFYGYRIFLQRSEDEAVTRRAEPQLYSPRNSNHVIGPGDSFILTLWGDAELRTRLTVSSEGTVHIQNIGVVSVHGLTVEELENRMKGVLSRRFRTINPPDGNPTTFFDIHFDKLSVVNIFVTGEVVSQGPFQVNPNTTVLSALIRAGGVTPRGTLRNIQIIRNNQVISVFDVYDYLHTGKNVNEVVLKNGDNVFVGHRMNTIELTGEVVHPLKFEIRPDETLSDLIRYSGGIMASASVDHVTIERMVPIEQRLTPVVYSKLMNVRFTTLKDGELHVNPVRLYDKDIVTVNPIPRVLTEYVVLHGAVYRRGRYGFEEGMTLNDLLEKSGGMLADAYTERVELIRTHPDQRTEYRSLNLATEDAGIELSPLDSINIRSKWHLQSRKVVAVNGYIANPGFKYLADSTRVSDLIFSKGGILDEWRRNRTYMYRAQLTRDNRDGHSSRIIDINLERVLLGDKDEDILLEDGDHLMIYDIYSVESRGTVTITGYVKNEGEYRLTKGMRPEDLILKANGFKEGAYETKAVVFRMNAEQGRKLSIVHEIELEKNYFRKPDSKKSDFVLMDKDHVVIRRNPLWREPRKVTISGEVKFPGVYTILHPHETYAELIQRAGGLTEEAFIAGTHLQRDTVRVVSDFIRAYERNDRFGIILREGDDVHIPKSPGTVMVEGFVYTPGLIKYRSDWRLSDYIEAAGGKISSVDYAAGKTVIYYPGGNAEVDDSWFYSPKVREGSRIVVPQVRKEPEKEWRGEIRGWLGLITSTLTVVLLMQAAQK